VSYDGDRTPSSAGLWGKRGTAIRPSDIECLVRFSRSIALRCSSVHTSPIIKKLAQLL